MVYKTLLSICMLLPLTCIAQTPLPGNASLSEIKIDSTVANNINNRLKGFLTTRQAEKTYLHLDKPYYAAGDTIYFKAYITLGEYHELSNLSGVLHVDLINAANQVTQSRILQIVNGMAWGDFALPAAFIKGPYHIRAYTKYMRNAGDDSFFEQNIPVVDYNAATTKPAGINGDANPVKSSTNKPDIRFFPEGGNLVQGNTSKVAFKAIGANGLGLSVKGIIIDNDNKEVASFTSTHLGMGYFNLDVAEGKTYKAKVTYLNGTQDIVPLPVADAKGITLAIDNSSRYASIVLRANKAYFQENKDKIYTVFIYGGGAATTTLVKLDKTTAKAAIDKQQFPSGVARITLFSPTGEPLDERLLFIKNNDQLKLSINSDKAQYAKRENTSITLNAADKDGKLAEGHFSVSVIDQTKMNADENMGNNLLSHLLLTSELSGYIEKPAYYFNNTSNQIDADLDLVMLTHGYRRFEWKKLMNEGYPANKYSPENTLEIAGTAKTVTGKPLANTAVSITAKDKGLFITQDTVTDKEGNFKFLRMQYANETRFLIKTKGGNNTTLAYNSELPLPVNYSNPLPDTAITNLYNKNLKIQANKVSEDSTLEGKILNEVKIKDKKSGEPTVVTPSKFIDSKIYYGKDMVSAGKFSSALQQAGTGVVFKQSDRNLKKGIGKNPLDVINIDAYLPGQTTPLLIIIDGVEYTENINDINVDYIETVEVISPHTQSRLFYGALSRAEGGVLVITTDRNRATNNVTAQTGGTLYITPQGFYKAREFYVPKYGHLATAQTKEDMRSTIYWQPELVTDKNGNASFSYPNADGVGNYLVVIEGIDNNGNLGSTRYTYKVQ